MTLRNTLAVLLMLCPFFKSAAQSRFLTGIIRMEGRPVSGLIVYTPFATTKTDDLGRYSLSLAGCPVCKPGYVLNIYTTKINLGSSEQSCTINNDYRYDFNIARSRITIYGIVKSSGINAGPLQGIEVHIIAGDTNTSPVLTDSLGSFKLPIFSALLESRNTVWLQVRDPNGIHKPIRVEPEQYNINALNIITMEPTNTVDVEVKVKVNTFTSTIICVRKSDLVTMEAGGHIRDETIACSFDADGKKLSPLGISLESYNIVPNINHAALLYRLEGEREWRLAGKKKQFAAGRDGCIEFQVNDNIQDDNVGSYLVKITVQRS